LDGFVRMEMDFEVMLCDFTAGLEIASFNNVIKYEDPSLPPPPPGRNSTEGVPFESSAAPRIDPPGSRIFECLLSGTFHDRFPGDVRIRLDLSGLVSFYDPSLAPSLIEKRRGRERWDHRLEGIHADDLTAVKVRLSEILTAKRGKLHRNSGLDWLALFRTIIKRYGDRLETMQYILSADSGTLGDEKERVAKAHFQSGIMLAPYRLTSAIPPNSTDGANSTWASPVFRQCATAHTAYIASSMSFLTHSERLLLNSVQETTREICRVLVIMWSDGVMAKIEDEDWNPGEDRVKAMAEKWRAELNGLMKWLDWSQWVKCRPTCGLEEICYLPTWPFFQDGDGFRPQPRCVRRIEPYSFTFPRRWMNMS